MAAVALSACAAEASSPETPPPALELTGRVVDAADILSPEFEAQLTRRLAALEEQRLVQLVVVSTPGLDGQDIADYTFGLGNAWEIGDAERNDGLIILIAPNERRVRIEVGLGLEQTVTNEEAAGIIEGLILPHFREGDFEAGVNAGVDGLANEIAQTDLKEAA